MILTLPWRVCLTSPHSAALAAPSQHHAHFAVQQSPRLAASTALCTVTTYRQPGNAQALLHIGAAEELRCEACMTCQFCLHCGSHNSLHLTKDPQMAWINCCVTDLQPSCALHCIVLHCIALHCTPPCNATLQSPAFVYAIWMNKKLIHVSWAGVARLRTHLAQDVQFAPTHLKLVQYPSILS